MQTLIKYLKAIRGYINRSLYPASSYLTSNEYKKPLSKKFGFDRGTPIDRYWIEDFLEKKKSFIKGRCLEITDNSYTQKYGRSSVTKSDVLDIDKENKMANIFGDLRNLMDVVKDNTYDTVILTHVLGLIDNVDNAVSEVFRILKPGGVVLATSSCLSPTYGDVANYWRFTPNGFRYLFGKHFGQKNIEVGSYGNILSGQYFWVGMSQEDISEKVLKYNDDKYPCISTAVAIKK